MSADPLDDRDDCQHYYADPSGGFGWPSCVKCGKPASLVENAALRACCRTPETGEHAPGCRSMDAMRRVGASWP